MALDAGVSADRGTGGDAAELFEIARTFGAIEQMRPEIEVAIESMTWGMKP